MKCNYDFNVICDEKCKHRNTCAYMQMHQEAKRNVLEIAADYGLHKEIPIIENEGGK